VYTRFTPARGSCLTEGEKMKTYYEQDGITIRCPREKCQSKGVSQWHDRKSCSRR
jgi:hypothetical protein